MMQKQDITNMGRTVLVFLEGKKRGISLSKRFQRWRVLAILYYYMVRYAFSIIKKRQQTGVGG
jgi:hypothetical protein